MSAGPRLSRPFAANLLTAVAGWVDAVGILLFLTQLQIFPTYMSGNTTRLFVAAAQGEWQRMAMYGVAIVLFVCGVIGGRIVNDGRRWRETAALVAEAALLLCASVAAARGAAELLTLGLLAAAMGWNNMALKARHGIGPKGHVTGTLVSFATSIADTLSRRERSWTAVWTSAVVWGSMALGALAGAVSTRFVDGALVLLAPALAVGLCAVAVACGWLGAGATPTGTD